MTKKTEQTWFGQEGIELPDLGNRPFIPEGKTQTFRPTAVRKGYTKTINGDQELLVLLVLEGTVEGRGEQLHEWEVTSKLAAARLRDVLKDGPRPLHVKRTGSGTETAYFIEPAKDAK